MTQEAQVKITADNSSVRQSLREMVAHMRSAGADGKAGFEKALVPLVALRERFIALTAVLGGGALFGKAVQEAAQFSEQSIQLGNALGVSASGASTWIAALKDVGSSSEELSTASRGLLRNVRDNEKGLNDMGLKTRDASGNLRSMNDLVLDAIAVTNSYAAGTDRQVAAQQIFGKGLDASSNLLKLNTATVRENEQFMRELGLVVGEQQVQAYRRFDEATDRTQLVLQATRNVIGQAMMPVLTKLSEWFNVIGPPAVWGFRVSVGILTSAFWGLKNVATIVFELLSAQFNSFRETLGGVAAGMAKLVTGDFRGAADELMAVPRRIESVWNDAWKNIVASSEEARDRMVELFVDGPDAKVPQPGRTGADGRSKPAAPPASYMQFYEAVLAEEKRVFAALEAGREYAREQELAYWRFLSQNAQLTTADRLAVTRRMASLEAEIYRDTARERDRIEREAAKERDRLAEQSAQTSRALALEEVQAAERFALGKVDAEASAARGAVELGQMTKAQLMQLEVQFEDERFRIQAAALRERLRLAALDPNMSPVELARLKNELLLIEQQHAARRGELLIAAVKEKGSVGELLHGTFGESSTTWGNLLDGLLARTLTWRQAMASIFGGLRDIFVKTLVTEPLAAWIGSLAKMLLAKLGFAAQEKGIDVATSATRVATKAGETGLIVGANAAQAGSGAAVSQAAIPVIGPALALAAMAAVYAAVSGLGGSVKSAAGGYNIPRNVFPLTQLHEEEMVLPSPLANAVRRMAANEERLASAPAPRPVSITINAVDARGVRDLFMNNQHALVKALENAEREFAWRRSK